MTWCELQGIPWVLTHCHMFNISNGNCFRCFTSVFCLCSSKNPLRISQFAGNTWCFFCFFWAKNPWFPAQISPTKPRHTSTHKNPPFLMRLSPYLFGKNHGFMQIFPETNPCLIEFIYGLSRFSTVSSDSQIQMFLWLVVSNIFWIFHFIYGMSSFPLTKSYFLRWFFNHQPVVFLHKKNNTWSDGLHSSELEVSPHVVHSASEDKLVVTYARGPGGSSGGSYVRIEFSTWVILYLYIYI